MRPLFESLEGREFLSATIGGIPQVHSQPVGNPVTMSLNASSQTLAAIQSVKGTWNGTLSVTGVHDRPVTIKITKQAANGTVTGQLTTSLDPSIVVAVSGKVKANGGLSISLVGAHSGGAINGTGTGKLGSTAKTMSFKLSFVQGGQSFPGTITLTKGGTSTTPTPVTSPGTGSESEIETGSESETDSVKGTSTKRARRDTQSDTGGSGATDN